MTVHKYTQSQLEEAVRAAEERGYARGFSAGRQESTGSPSTTETGPYYATGQPAPPVRPDGAWASDYPEWR